MRWLLTAALLSLRLWHLTLILPLLPGLLLLSGRHRSRLWLSLSLRLRLDLWSGLDPSRLWLSLSLRLDFRPWSGRYNSRLRLRLWPRLRPQRLRLCCATVRSFLYPLLLLRSDLLLSRRPLLLLIDSHLLPRCRPLILAWRLGLIRLRHGLTNALTPHRSSAQTLLLGLLL